MTTGKYIVLKEAKFLFIKGKDNKDFLQGIITNDINKCNKKVIYSCLLSPQGKFLSDFFIIPFNDSFLIEINQKFFNDFIAKLKLYKLRSNINIDETNDFTSVVIINNSSSNSTEEGQIILDKEYIEYVDPRNKNLGNRVVIKPELIDNLIKSKNYSLSNTNEYQKIMIQNLIPNSLNDLIVNKSLLLENNFDQINALDWDKGCYVGQEITARMKHRSLLKKQIYSLEVISGKVDIGEALKNDQVHLGTVISKTNKFIVAMLKIEPINEIIKNNKFLETAGGKFKIIH